MLERNRALAAHLGALSEPLADHPHVANIRQTGMIAALDLVRAERHAALPAAERRGLRVYLHGLEHECLLRPLGNVVYFMPPYVITKPQIDHMVGDGRGRHRAGGGLTGDWDSGLRAAGEEFFAP